MEFFTSHDSRLVGAKNTARQTDRHIMGELRLLEDGARDTIQYYFEVLL